MVRVVPFHYTGKVWCLRVPTGAFVAVRNGVAFPTGNSGFPKSLDVSKAIDRAAGAEREVVGIKPNYHSEGKRAGTGANMHGVVDGSFSNPEAAAAITAPATEAARQWQGWGTALKPALEPITVARKPLIGTVSENVLTHGTGALNIDGCRVETDDKFGGGPMMSSSGSTIGQFAEYVSQPNVPGSHLGRWPANIIHDGSDEVLAAFPIQTSGSRAAGVRKGMGFHGADGDGGPAIEGSTGSAARFFYCAKASRSDRNEGLASGDKPAVGTGATMRERESADWPARNGNHHPTVKPTDLMRYLVRLVTPPGGVVLDPFMGSGSTGKAAVLEGFRFIGCELSEEYLAIAQARIEHELSKRQGETPKPSPQVDLFGT